MAAIVSDLILLYIIAIFLMIVFSWFPQSPGTPGFQIYSFLRRITDPVLLPIRRMIPPIGGVVDLSPTIVILVLFALRSVISR